MKRKGTEISINRGWLLFNPLAERKKQAKMRQTDADHTLMHTSSVMNSSTVMSFVLVFMQCI